MQKKHYYRLILIFLIIFIFSNNCYAINWYGWRIGNDTIELDEDSVTQKGDSIFYNVKYYEPESISILVVTVQSKNGQVGIVTTQSKDEYDKNPIIDTSKEAKLKPLTYSSRLYEIDKYANKMINEKVDWQPYMKKLTAKIGKNWTVPRYGHPKQATKVKFVLDRYSCIHGDPIITQSSGSSEHDNSAKWAVSGCFYLPFPKNTVRHYRTIEFTFDYKALFK